MNTLLLCIILAAQNGSEHGRAGDFNGDGRDDLAVGVRGETAGGHPRAGAVNVLYGGSAGISASGDQFLHQDSSNISSSCEDGDEFGSELASGDFNGDGRDDLAIGSPREDFGASPDGGVVHVVYGGVSALSTAKVDYWHENVSGIADSAEAYELFGGALAAGDFDDDGYDDLAIANPRERINGAYSAGSVHVLYGTPGGLVATGNQYLFQGPGGLLGGGSANFGSALAAGDFDLDGFQDLAIGAPGDIDYFGSVTVLYGSGGGLQTSRYHYWHQTGTGLGTSAHSDMFGTALAAGDFGEDGASDLAIGVPQDNDSANGGGAVIVLYGLINHGTRTGGGDYFTQNTAGITGSGESGDCFGFSLAAGDLDSNGRDDLAVGAPFEDLEHLSAYGAGVVHVLYGSASGLTSSGSDFWSQEGPELLDWPTNGDDFGASLLIGDFDGDGYGDLVIGAPGEHKVNPFDYGVVHVIYGTSTGLDSTGSQHWDQDDPGVIDAREDNDYFGGTLG